ncbi:MAG TPA: hypothetical protein VGN07_16050 [Steroidobacteraceae bacterium]|jgi:hypothetical protein
MSCILSTEASIGGLKAKLREEFTEVPESKSSHVSEALARALGFDTHAALLAAVRSPNRLPPPEDDYRQLDYEAFRQRLLATERLR